MKQFLYVYIHFDWNFNFACNISLLGCLLSLYCWRSEGTWPTKLLHWGFMDDYYQVLTITIGADIFITCSPRGDHRHRPDINITHLTFVLYKKKSNITFLLNFREHAATGTSTASFRAPCGMGRYESEFLQTRACLQGQICCGWPDWHRTLLW